MNLHEPNLEPLNPELIKTPKIHSEADMNHYVAQYRQHFDAIQEHKTNKRKDGINYQKLWEQAGKSHVKARVAIEKLCREDENHRITRDEEKRRAKETATILETMAKRTATMVSFKHSIKQKKERMRRATSRISYTVVFFLFIYFYFNHSYFVILSCFFLVSNILTF